MTAPIRLLAGLLLLAASATGSHFSWLPLGDSITWGCGNGFSPHEPSDGCEADAASYRIPTAQALEQANVSITAVGSRSAGPASAPASWKSHEGHPGWRIDELTAVAPAWAALGPDVVTVLAGANDCLQGDGAALAIARMTAVLNATTALLPSTKADGGRGQLVYVPVAEGTVGVCGDDKTTYSIGDGVHPNAAGHARVASVFARFMRYTLCPNFEVDRSC